MSILPEGCEFSQEQRDIAAAIQEGNVLCRAVAGSGKTTTLLLCAVTQPHLRHLILTYNKRLQLDVAAKAARVASNVAVFTYHAAVGRAYGHVVNNDEKLHAAVHGGAVCGLPVAICVGHEWLAVPGGGGGAQQGVQRERGHVEEAHGQVQDDLVAGRVGRARLVDEADRQGGLRREGRRVDGPRRIDEADRQALGTCAGCCGSCTCSTLPEAVKASTAALMQRRNWCSPRPAPSRPRSTTCCACWSTTVD